MIDSLQILFKRDLKRLSREIEQFDALKVWKISGDIRNSAGNLCLHVCGNLQYYIGAVLGGSGYIRDRENEFTCKDISQPQLLETIDVTRLAVQKSLDKVTTYQLDRGYPENVLGRPMTVRFFLIHLQGHLNYHLGQINYLRRL